MRISTIDRDVNALFATEYSPSEGTYRGTLSVYMRRGNIPVNVARKLLLALTAFSGIGNPASRKAARLIYCPDLTVLNSHLILISR